MLSYTSFVLVQLLDFSQSFESVIYCICIYVVNILVQVCPLMLISFLEKSGKCKPVNMLLRQIPTQITSVHYPYQAQGDTD